MRRSYIHAAAALAGMTATYLIGVTTAPAFADRHPPVCCVCPTPTDSGSNPPTANPPPPITHLPPPPPVTGPPSPPNTRHAG